MGRTSDAKEKLLRVAFDLIWEQSYGAVSVDDICERANVKKGSFYYFFPSKSDLAVAASKNIGSKIDRVTMLFFLLKPVRWNGSKLIAEGSMRVKKLKRKKPDVCWVVLSLA